MVKLNIKMNILTILGYLCFFLSLIFAIVGMSIDPKIKDLQDDQLASSHMNLYTLNTTFSMFAQTLALMGLGFFYLGNK